MPAQARQDQPAGQRNDHAQAQRGGQGAAKSGAGQAARPDAVSGLHCLRLRRCSVVTAGAAGGMQACRSAARAEPDGAWLRTGTPLRASAPGFCRKRRPAQPWGGRAAACHTPRRPHAPPDTACVPRPSRPAPAAARSSARRRRPRCFARRGWPAHQMSTMRRTSVHPTCECWGGCLPAVARCREAKLACCYSLAVETAGPPARPAVRCAWRPLQRQQPRRHACRALPHCLLALQAAGARRQRAGVARPGRGDHLGRRGLGHGPAGGPPGRAGACGPGRQRVGEAAPAARCGACLPCAAGLVRHQGCRFCLLLHRCCAPSTPGCRPACTRSHLRALLRGCPRGGRGSWLWRGRGPAPVRLRGCPGAGWSCCCVGEAAAWCGSWRSNVRC